MSKYNQLLAKIARALENAHLPYVVIGAFAGSTYGVTRTTGDVDIVVDLNNTHIDALAESYPSPRHYADPYQMRDSIRMGILFNIIDSSVGRKVDLIPLTKFTPPASVWSKSIGKIKKLSSSKSHTNKQEEKRKRLT